MADFANALVKFKIKAEFKDAFLMAFNNILNEDLDYLDFGFDHITTNGKYMEEYDEDCDYLSFDARIGCNFNLEGEFSVPYEQGIDKEDIATLCFSMKWGTVERLKYIIEEFMDYVAEEIIFCEIIGLHKIDFSTDSEEYYHIVSYQAEKGEWGIELKEIKKERIFNENGD